MSAGTREAIDREEFVNLAIYDFHEAVDWGESPDPDEWADRYPEIESELRSYFDDLAALRLLHAPTSEVPAGTTAPMEEPGPDGPEPRPLAADLRPGDRLGDYVLLEKLAEGGQGEVWKASPRLQPEIVVALKTLRGPATNDPGLIYLLRQETDAIARMKHAHIIPIFFFGEDRGRWFFVMELVEGGTVADRLEGYKADPRSAAVLVEKIARAIHHAHSRGVLHRDLKPGNILLTADGEPKVGDFGLSVRCKVTDPSAEGPASDCPGEPDDAGDVSAPFVRAGVVGTIPYMSTEMADGRWRDVTTASDIYGLGAILYTMLTGRPPFRGRDAKETLALVVRGNPTSPRELNRRVDRELNAVCLKCLGRDPGKRYKSADALANDLRRWLGGRPTLRGGNPSAAREILFWLRRHPLSIVLAAVAALVLWLAGRAVSAVEQRAENRREAARLAGQVDRELRLIRRATQILASDPRLRSAFGASPAPAQSGRRRHEIEAFLKTAVEGEKLFEIVGVNPLVNVFVLGPKGVLLADTLPDSPAVGKDFSFRDYYRAFFESDLPRDYAYIARSFQSEKDGLYKIAASTRIRDGRGNLLGLLVASFTIGPRLIDVDMLREPDATVLCPMDNSAPGHGPDDRARPWRYIAVLDRHYTTEWKGGPIDVPNPPLPDFQGDATLVRAEGGPGNGELVDYHRIGETHMIVVMRRQCPWPLSWLPHFQ
jgi:serine/threonine-protein kinase